MAFNGAETVRVEDLEDKLLQAILGNGPLAGFSPLIKKLFNSNIIGSNNDALLDAVLYTNMTPTGVFMDQQTAMQQRIAAQQLSHLKTASRSQWFEAAAKTMMSYESWSQAKGNEGKSIEQYNADMHNRAAGMAENGVIDFLLNMTGFDPDGLNEVRTYLGKAGSNIARHRRSAGQVGAFAASRAVHNLFTDAEGNLDYDRSKYGYMTMGETATVVAALTRDIDYFNTPEVKSLGSNVEKIKAASDNIKKAAQDYTKALSPLKDVFGSDVPAMIQALEQVTGRRFTQMSAEQVSSATRRIMAGADAGRYTLKQLTTVENQVADAIYGMNVPIINDISALAQAQTILGITNTGLIPSSMSAHRFEQIAADKVMRTSNSRGATAVNQAYALWREEKDKEARRLRGDDAVAFIDDATAFAKFQEDLNKLTAQGVGIDRALLELSGESNIYSLHKAAGSQYYQAAVEQNLGGAVALERSAAFRIQQERNRAQLSGNGKAFDEAIAALQAEGGLSILNSEENLRNSGLLAEAQRQVRMIRNSEYGDLGAVISASQTAKEIAVKTQKNMQLRTSIEGLGTAFAENPVQLIGDFMGLRANSKGGLPTTESIIDILRRTQTLKAASDEVITLSAATMQAAGSLADLKGGDEETRKAYIADYIKYAAKDGIANAHYVDALNDYYKALGSNDEGKQRRALMALEAARYGNEDLLEQYDNKLGLDQLYTEMESPGFDTAEINDYIKGELFYKKIEDVYKGADKQSYEYRLIQRTLQDGSLRAAIKEAGLDPSELKGSSLMEVLKKTEAGQQIIADIGEDVIKDWANTETAKSDAQTRTQSDLFGTMDKLIEKIDELLTGIKPLIPGGEGEGTPAPGVD